MSSENNQINTHILHISSSDNRQSAKILLNKLITKISTLENTTIDGTLIYYLEKPEKNILSEKEENKLTKWNKFASKKQIKRKSKDSKLIYNEENKTFERKAKFYKPKK